MFKKIFYILIIFSLFISINTYAQTDIPGLDELNAAPASGDQLHIIDVSDTSMAADGTDKYILMSNILSNVNAALGISYGAVNLGTFTGSTIPDNQTTKQALQALETEIETKISADEKMFMGVTIQEFSSADTTPDVSNASTGVNAVYRVNANGTITDFDDGDDHSEFSNGDSFLLIVDDASTTIDFITGTNIIGNSGVNFTGSASQKMLLLFIYTDSAWHCGNLYAGLSDPSTINIGAIGIATYAHFTNADNIYSDNSTPHVLVSKETKGTILTNCGATEDRVYTLHTYDHGMNFMIEVCAAYQMDLEPPSGGVIYLNGTAASADEHIINASDTKGDVMSCWSIEASNDTWEVHCKSDSDNWVEATP